MGRRSKTRSGDITSTIALDWVGQSSKFDNCFPADIISYAAPLRALPSLSEDAIQTAAFSLRNIVAMDLVSKLYNLFENMNTPLIPNCRLHLLCIVFRATKVKRSCGHAAHSTYGVKLDGLCDLLIAGRDTNSVLAGKTRQTFFLVRPWDHHLLELPDFADEAENIGYLFEPKSSGSPLGIVS
ncbi:hypothetical protein F4604DRAFT_1709996 [Suillus subluteus]|nr:hypothetical protein F4604DRAFT_1709996 [Suillus subluteus]